LVVGRIGHARGGAQLSTIGKRLRHLRVERGLTQTEVTGSEYSKEYVSQVELGKTLPSRRAIELFAKYLDVDESYFETGIDSAGRERFESLLAAGAVLTERGEAEEALVVFERARVIATRAENPTYNCRVDTGRAWALHALGRHPEALDLLAGSRAYYLAAAPEGRELADVLYRLGHVREAVGDLQSALGLYEETLSLLDPEEQPGDSLRLRTLSDVVGIHARRHDLVAAAQAAQKALELAEASTDRRAVADAWWEAARVEERRGDYARSYEYALRARDLLVELGERRGAARVLHDLGSVRTRMGAAGEALACFDSGLELLRTTDDPVARAELLNGSAAAKLALGDHAGAYETAGASLDALAGDRSATTLVGDAHLTRSAALLAAGQIDRARGEFEAAVAAYGPEADRTVQSRLSLAEGDVLLAEGRVAEAAAVFRRSAIVLQGMDS
jgi:tetratricopeptide (TPR) repeat protein